MIFLIYHVYDDGYYSISKKAFTIIALSFYERTIPRLKNIYKKKSNIFKTDSRFKTAKRFIKHL